MNARPTGRPFFFAPGPTNIPDRILNAMNKPTADFLSPDFLEIHARVHEGIKRVLKTKQHMFMYAANGHGAWEAALSNVLSPGEKVLSLESGFFSHNWAHMATDLGALVETLPADWRLGVTRQALAARLKADTAGEIKAILVAHNETATGVMMPLKEVRQAIDEANHKAMLFADTISSLGSFDFQMDAWGVDVVVGGSQKGLMMTTGMSFTGVSDRALERSRHVKSRRSYWDWADMQTRSPQKFPGTTPVHMFFGLDESLAMIEVEGLDAIFRRHHKFANATRAAIAHWGRGRDKPGKDFQRRHLRKGQSARTRLRRSRAGVRLGVRRSRARRRRCECIQEPGLQPLQPQPRQRPRSAKRACVPDWSHGRPQRTHGARSAGNCRAGLGSGKGAL